MEEIKKEGEILYLPSPSVPILKLEEKKEIGRPTTFSQELANEICLRIAEGESVRRIIESKNMPSSSTIYRWLLDEEKKLFWEQYARARNMQAEIMFEELLDIADDGSNDYMTISKGKTEYNVEDREVTNRSKLRVETRKWYLSKVLPKKFGDKVDVTSGGEIIKGNTINFNNFTLNNATNSQ